MLFPIIVGNDTEDKASMVPLFLSFVGESRLFLFDSIDGFVIIIIIGRGGGR